MNKNKIKVAKVTDEYNKIINNLTNDKTDINDYLILNINRSDECEDFYKIKYYLVNKKFDSGIINVPNINEVDLIQEEVEMFLEYYNQIFDMKISLGEMGFPFANTMCSNSESGIIEEKTMNKRGFVIGYDELISFDENLDHTYNMKNIIRNRYKEYECYLDQINVFSGAIILSDEGNVVVLNTFDNQFQIYLPEMVNELTIFQTVKLNGFLNRNETDDKMIISSYPKPNNLDSPIINYKKEEIINILNNNIIPKKYK